jgi:hypothetical protein
LWLQQSPGQHEAFCWQHDAPQQLPGQHFAVFEQHAAPVAARAVSDNRDMANRANIFDFMMEFLSV